MSSTERPLGLKNNPYRPRTAPNRGPITYQERRQSSKAWAAEFGVPYTTFCKRMRSGWTIEEASQVGRFYSEGAEHAQARGKTYEREQKRITDGELRCRECGRPF
jgi:hypothetical protein